MKTQNIRLNGIDFRFSCWGNPQKPKLFLIHGWLDSGASYEFVCRHLQKKYFCIAPDLRGYGKSGHGKNPLGYFFFEHIADLHAIFAHFSPKHPVRVLGHSLGGALTGIYAGTYPERVSHFINVEGYAFRDNPVGRGPEKIRQWIHGHPPQPFKTYASRGAFATGLRKTYPRLTAARATYLAQHLAKKTRQGFQLSADPLHRLADPAVFTREMIYVFWERIRARCLLVHGDETNLNQWVQAKNIAKELRERFRHFPKNTKQTTIKECGHMVHYDQPEKLAAAVLSFH